MLLIQIVFPVVGHPASQDQKTITGFVFQDNNLNGIYDDGDNVFPAVTIHIEAVDSDSALSVAVSTTGYFEVDGLDSDNYVVYAEYHGYNSTPQAVQFDSSLSHVNVLIGIQPLTVFFIEPSTVQVRADDTVQPSEFFTTVMLPIVHN